ncbi:hypothetical protein LCGC14_2963760, partial [marine sediment metagenome]
GGVLEHVDGRHAREAAGLPVHHVDHRRVVVARDLSCLVRQEECIEQIGDEFLATQKIIPSWDWPDGLTAGIKQRIES